MKRLSLILLIATLTFPSVGDGGGKNAKDGKKEETDPKTWTPIKIQGGQKAPEFKDIEEWINSSPLTMQELKGKVIVIHFMAFG